MSEPIVKLDASNLLFFDDAGSDPVAEGPTEADTPETFMRTFRPSHMAMVGGKGTITSAAAFSDADL